MTDITDIQDILALGGTHPTEQALPAKEKEDSIRHAGTRWLIAGSGILTTAIIGTLVLAVVNPAVLANPAASLLLHLVGMLIAAVGGALIAAGLIERTQRPTRTLIRAAMARAKTNGDTADGTRGLVGKLIEVIKEIQRRIDGILQTVELMTAALDEIATHLPENQKIHNWRGFNEATREGFTEAVGEVPRPRPALGLLPGGNVKQPNPSNP